MATNLTVFGIHDRPETLIPLTLIYTIGNIKK